MCIYIYIHICICVYTDDVDRHSSLVVASASLLSSSSSFSLPPFNGCNERSQMYVRLVSREI